MSLLTKGVSYFNQIAQGTNDPQHIRNVLSKHHTDLSTRIAGQAPGRRDLELIEKLQIVDVASAIAKWDDAGHPNAQAAIKRAAEGLSPTGNRLYSAVLAAEDAAARAPAETPRERFTVRADHNGRMV